MCSVSPRRLFGNQTRRNAAANELNELELLFVYQFILKYLTLPSSKFSIIWGLDLVLNMTSLSVYFY